MNPTPAQPAHTPLPERLRVGITQDFKAHLFIDKPSSKVDPAKWSGRMDSAALAAELAHRYNTQPLLLDALKAAEQWFNEYEECLGDKHSAHVSDPITAAIARASREEGR